MAYPPETYWLIHEPGKIPGFGIIERETAATAEQAVACWRVENAEIAVLCDAHGQQLTARLVERV